MIKALKYSSHWVVHSLALMFIGCVTKSSGTVRYVLAISMVQNFGLSEEQRGRVEKIISAIKWYVDGHVNETVECRNFCRRAQQVGELFDYFLVSLRELVKTCNFSSEACTQKNILDHIIEGLLDDDTVEDLLQEMDLQDCTQVSCTGGCKDTAGYVTQYPWDCCST